MVSFWFLIALTALMILEVIPWTGPLLTRAGASFVAGWLVHLCLLSLFVDALIGAFPTAVAMIPILVYCGYYFARWDQEVYAWRKSSELRRTNSGKILDFDPGRYSLVMNQAASFAASHQIPVVYAYNRLDKPEEYVSYRLLTTDALSSYLREYNKTFQILTVYWDNVIQANVKELRVPERPPQRIVAATVTDNAGEGWKDRNIGEETTSITLDAKTIGVFKSAYILRLPSFPFLTIGCSFSTDPVQRKCGVDFITERMLIESRPDTVDQSLYDDPISIMLGIRKFTKKDISDFRSVFADSGAAAPAASRAAPSEDAAFEALRGVIYGESPPLSWSMGYLIANNPTRLAPLARGMAKRFVELGRTEDIDAPGRHEQATLLATGIVALAPADFAAVQDQLTDFARRVGAPEEYPLLYLRLADAGPRMFSIYRDRLLSHNATRLESLVSALAICRIGEADSELISAIKSQWSEFESGGAKDDNYKTALFVTLLKLGQENALRNAVRSDSPMLEAWYDAVLAGRGRTDVGPNNCMPMEWPGNEYVPVDLAPSLRWSQQKWQFASQK